MDALRKYIPEGARDILFGDCRRKVEVIDKLRKLYTSKGFMEIISPTLEFYDVFCDSDKLIGQEKMYKLFDNMGRILVLRPDMTIPIARIAATKLKDTQYPLRICYSGNIFRVNEIFNGKNSEITQSGVEILGVFSQKADLEVIVTAIEALLAIGIEEFQIELGQAEFFLGLVEDSGISSDETGVLRKLVEDKNYAALREFVDSREGLISYASANALKSLPELFGGMEILERARHLTNNKRSLEALDSIAEICEKLKRMGLVKYISIDLGMIQHIHYYTGITFRGYMPEVGGNILSGGRYDNLTAQYGRPMPAVGFAIDIDNIMIALERQKVSTLNKKSRILLYYDDIYLDTAYKLSNALLGCGYTVEWSLYEDWKQTLDYGRCNGIEKICSIMDENIIEVFNVRDCRVSSIDIDILLGSIGGLT